MKKKLSILLAAVNAFSMLSVTSFAQGERTYTNSSEDFSEHVSYSVKREALDNYAYMTEYAMENAGVGNIYAEDIRLGEPFYIFSETSEKQEQIYYFPILNSEDEFIYTLTVICTNSNCQLSLNNEMTEQLNDIDYYNLDYIFYRSGENVIAESIDMKQYISGYEYESLFDSLTFEEKHTIYMEAADSLCFVDVNSDCLDDDFLTVDGYTPEFDIEQFQTNETEVRCKLYNAQGQGSYGLCWAASVATTVNYIKGKNITPQNVANLLGIGYNDGGDIDDDEKALQHYEVYYRATKNTLSFDKIRKNISQKKPIIMSCKTFDYSSGHAVTLVGFKTIGTADNKLITIWNSALNSGNGGLTIVRYSDDGVSIQSSGKVFTWRYSVCYYL